MRKTALIFICFLYISSGLLGQIVPFGSSGWDYCYKQPVAGACSSPSDSPVGVAWTSPSYVKLAGEWTFANQSLPIGYVVTTTNPPNIYGGITIITILPFGSDASNKPTTAYVRQTITLPNPRSDYASFTLKLKADDGVRVYFNGTQVANHNLSSGNIGPGTSASVVNTDINNYTFNISNTFDTHPTDPNKITITAEIHQSTTDQLVSCTTPSSDMFFDMELTGTLGPVTPAITRGPYLQLPHPTGMQIRWRTNTTFVGRVCYGTSLGSLTSCEDDDNSTPANDHMVNLTGLLPNITYFYAIQHTTGTLVESSPNHKFTTPPANIDNNKTTRIWVTGDHQDDYLPDVQDQVKAGFINYYMSQNSPPIDLWLVLGDVGDYLGRDFEYDAYFFNYYDDGNFKLMQQTPILPSPGNHDYYNGETITVPLYPQSKIDSLQSNNKIIPPSPSDLNGSPNDVFGSDLARSNFRISRENPFFNLFSFPPSNLNKYSTTNNNSKKGYYSYNHNNIHFISLDSYGFYNNYLLFGDTTSANNNNPQFKWLIEDLNATKNNPDIKWTIMFWHHSPYTNAGGHGSDSENSDEFILRGIREKLIKFLDNKNYKIDLILNGHSHAYQRSKLLKGHHGLSGTFDPVDHNNSFLNTNFNSNANSDGKYSTVTQCPYFKSPSNTKNEGIVYVVTGSSSQIQRRSKAPGEFDFTTGHRALNGSYFRPQFTRSVINNSGTSMVTETVLPQVEDTYGGSFLIEVKGNRLDAKFVNQLGEVTDEFTILKESITIPQYISVNDLPGQTPELRKIRIPTCTNWGLGSQYKITGPSISGELQFTGPEVILTNPHIGPLYTIKSLDNTLQQNYNFLFDDKCWTDVTINNTFNTTVPQVINATGKITSGSKILNTSNIRYNAGLAITLTPGSFFVPSTAKFQTKIGPVICP